MARDIDVHQILRSFAQKNKLTRFEYRVFAAAVQRQARLAPQAEAVYRDLALNPDTVLVPRLFLLAREHKIAVESSGNEIHSIVLPEHFSEVFLQEYRRMDENPDVPFPEEDMLKIIVPSEWIQTVGLDTDLGAISEKAAEEKVPLYRIVFPDNQRPIVVPAAFVPDRLLDLSVLKVRQYLRRGANKEFIQNKLLYAFASKEIQLKEALSAVLTKPQESVAELKTSSSDFIFPFWAYLTSHIKKDLDKKTDKNLEDSSIYQAATICEFYCNYFKGKAQRLIDLDAAFKALDIALRKAPYHFSIEEISVFCDSKGQPLLGKYDRAELEDRLKEKTTKSDPDELPEILVVSTGSGRRSYIVKERLFPLTMRLVTEARAEIRAKLLDQWHRTLADFGRNPAMEDDSAYLAELSKLVEARFPLLDALIRDSFLPLVYAEFKEKGEVPADLENLFYKGQLVSLDKLLELPRKDLYSDARMLLPFWYAVPFLAGFMRFLLHLGTEKTRPAKKAKEAKAAMAETARKLASPAQAPKDRRVEFSQAAQAVSRELLPVGCGLEEYLRELEGRWNTMIDPVAKANLTEDVNSLIRDYLRSVLRSMRAGAFTTERVKGLAATLADAPTLLKIKNHSALELYIQLYMTKVLQRR